jgi:glycosyltransferase involved in cell wall biosynthesis
LTLRILHVAHGWPPHAFGGTELYAAALADAQIDAGWAVSRWTPDGLPRAAPGFRSSYLRPEAETSFRAALERHKPDLVHIHHLTGSSMRIPRLARDAGARVVLTLHDAWLACARGQLVDATGSRCPGPSEERCARCLAPAFWAPLPYRIASRLPLRRELVRERADTLVALFDAVDALLTPSRHLAARLGLEAEWAPLPLTRRIEPAPPAPPGPVRFLFLGAMIPTKGPHIAVEAFARLPAGAASLTLIGPAPPYEGRLDYVHRLGRRVAELPGVELRPACRPEAVERVLADADVLLFPSTWEENSPLVLREAAAAGLRIVASDVPGSHEVLGDRGVRVEPGAVDAWRRALAAEVRRGRGREAPAAGVSMAAHLRRVEAVYRRALARRARRDAAAPAK